MADEYLISWRSWSHEWKSDFWKSSLYVLCPLARHLKNQQSYGFVISGFRRYLDEICTLLGYYAAYSDNPYRRFGTTYRPHLQGSKNWVRNYHSKLCNIPECRSQRYGYSKLFCEARISNTKTMYERVFRNSRTEAIAKYTTPNTRMWKLPTSTQLRATWHTDSLDIVVLPSTGASR
jgi:hypothetical protein